MKKDCMLLYGIFAYFGFVLTIAYSIAFFGNLFVTRTIDAVAIVPFGEASLVNFVLLILFGLQHGGMARRPFKRWLYSRINPRLERSTYVMASSIAVIVLMVFWQPIGGIVWLVSSPYVSGSIFAFYFAGWGLMFYATLLIDHFHLFGLCQAWNARQGVDCPERRLRTPGLYRHVRHPIYLGWLLVIWATPIMTITHLMFAAGMTIYMLVSIRLEERDLAVEIPDYRQYIRKVPMLLPSWRRRLLPENEQSKTIPSQ
jgi:protein-S-isoprenylcysteine O-methyltransferase Ste14